MKKGDIVLAIGNDEDNKWNICIGQVARIDKRDGMVAIYILDSKEPSVNPDGEYGLKWGDGIRWFDEKQLTLLES